MVTRNNQQNRKCYHETPRKNLNPQNTGKNFAASRPEYCAKIIFYQHNFQQKLVHFGD